jgi:hypothetical protein
MSTEVTQISYFSRIKNAFAGIVFGPVLAIGACVLLFWNEGRAVTTARSLTEGAAAVVSVSPDKVDSANEARLVHVSGPASVSETLTDAVFGVSVPALRLRRKAEMFQWEESKQTQSQRQTGGSVVQTTTYSYNKKWSATPINSASFHEAAGHENPVGIPYASQDWSAGKVTVGAFTLSGSLVGQITNFEPLPVTSEATQHLPAELNGKLKPSNGAYYQAADPANPQIGDVRVSFESIQPETVSVISKQLGSTFEPYGTKAGRNIDILSVGSHSADEMFKSAEESNILLTWGLRALGFFLMFFGISLLFQPLVILADVLPFLGSLVGVGTGLLAFTIAAALSCVTIAIAWLTYRPIIGGALLVAAIVFLVKGVQHQRAAKTAQIPAHA